MPRDISKPASLTLIVLIYAAAGAAALLLGRALPDWHPLWVVLACDVAATLVVFAAAVAMDNTSVYDPYWSVAPLPIALYLMAAGGGGITARAALVLALVAAWGARLTYNWASGWAGMGHEDWRYHDMRGKSGRLYWLVSFTGLQMMPTLIVFLGCMSLWPVMAAGARPVGPLDLLALLVTAGAIGVEALADHQLRRFVRSGPEPEAIMRDGLWARCRHPNYLGELGFWWGLWLFGLAAAPGPYWTVAGPLAMTGLFVGISIPLIDRRMLRKRPGYAEHRASVPALIPYGKKVQTGE